MISQIIIPKRRTITTKSTNGNCLKVRHYELDYISKYIVVYKCLETGIKESFSKNDFIKYNDIGDYEP